MRLSRLLKDVFAGLAGILLIPALCAQVDSVQLTVPDTVLGEGLFTPETVTIETPKITITGIEAKIGVQLAASLHEVARMEVEIGGEKQEVEFVDGRGEIAYTPQQSRETLSLRLQSHEQSISLYSIPLWLSILPPLIAILLALLFKEVIVSLFVGTFFGPALIQYYR